MVADGFLHDNLTFSQRQLLKWHRRLGHIGYHKIQQFSRLGLLPKELSTVCLACQFAKQKRSYNTSSLDTHSISAADSRPGDCLSIDLIHSSIGGLIPQNKGKPRTKRYNYACVFVGHATQLTHVVFQISSSAEETVQSKDSFEAFASTHGIHIKKYRADSDYRESIYRLLWCIRSPSKFDSRVYDPNHYFPGQSIPTTGTLRPSEGASISSEGDSAPLVPGVTTVAAVQPSKGAPPDHDCSLSPPGSYISPSPR